MVTKTVTRVIFIQRIANDLVTETLGEACPFRTRLKSTDRV